MLAGRGDVWLATVYFLSIIVPMSVLGQSIRVVSRRTGLSAHVIRIWEKRYRAVEPTRTPTNRRLYTEAEVERLDLLRHATEAGHAISHVASLTNEQLRTLLVRVSVLTERGNGRSLAASVDAQDFLKQAIESVRRLDAHGLEGVLRRANLEYGAQGLLQKLAAPLACRVGELWSDGEITAAHEHFATAVIRAFLGSLARPFAPAEVAPALVVATPAGQIHELGAVLVSAAATSHGWRAVYLGASLPAAEIAGAALRTHALAVALSIVHPSDDRHLPGELEELRRYLPEGIGIVAGGRAAGAYQSVLDRIGAAHCAQINDLYEVLEGLSTRSQVR